MTLNSRGSLALTDTLDTTQAIEGKCGYIIEDDSITGYKYLNDGLVEHGLRVATADDSDKNDNVGLILYMDGKIALNIQSYLEDGKRKTAFGVRNSEYDPSKPSSSSSNPGSWTAMRMVEGDNANVECYGNWDFSGATVTLGNSGSAGATGKIKCGNVMWYIENGLITGANYTSDGVDINLS